MNRQALFAKKEAIYGTAIALTAADVIHAENVKYQPKGEVVKGDPAKPGFGAVPGVVYGEHGELSFDVPLAGSGVVGTAPKWGMFMLAAGWTEDVEAAASVTYALGNPGEADSLTLKWRDAKRTHILAGARGRVSLKLAAGQRPMLSFVFKGLHADVTASAAPTPADVVWEGWIDSLPIQQGRTTFNLGGVDMTMRDFSLESSDNVVFTDVPHQENVELLGARELTGKLKAGTPDIALFNPETKWRENEVLTAALVHGVGSAGSIVTINSRGQIGEPTYSRDNDQDLFESSISLVGSNLGADDDIAIVLT